MYVSKESKKVSRNAIYFMQVNDPDEQEAGLDIVDDEEEEKMQKEEEDKEVVHIFKQSKQHHEQMLRGMCVKRVERNKIHVLIVFLLMSKELKVPVYKVNKHTVCMSKESKETNVCINCNTLLVYFRNSISSQGS